jgi:hypothetical protein
VLSFCCYLLLNIYYYLNYTHLKQSPYGVEISAQK